MIEVPVAYDDIEDGFSIAEPGIYRCIVVEGDEVTTGSGNPGIKLTIDILNSDGDKIGRAWKTFAITKKALWSLKNFHKMYGLPPWGNTIDPNAYVGLEITCEIGVMDSNKTDEEGNPIPLNTIESFLSND